MDIVGTIVGSYIVIADIYLQVFEWKNSSMQDLPTYASMKHTCSMDPSHGKGAE